jgi:hypothetical protein
MKKLLLVAYESRFARCGGITAVMNHLPGYLRTAAGVATSVITPFHHKSPQRPSCPCGASAKSKFRSSMIVSR